MDGLEDLTSPQIRTKKILVIMVRAKEVIGYIVMDDLDKLTSLQMSTRKMLMMVA